MNYYFDTNNSFPPTVSDTSTAVSLGGVIIPGADSQQIHLKGKAEESNWFLFELKVSKSWYILITE